MGYARVSTDEQKLDLQIEALQRADCCRIFLDHGISGGEFNRPGMDELLESLGTGDTLVVWRLDRLGRSIGGLIKLMEKLNADNIHLHSLMENIDTSSSGGRLVFHMMAALAEFEKSLISERTKAGLVAARNRGKSIGRPPALGADDLNSALRAVGDGEALSKVAERFKISSRSLRRAIDKRRPPGNGPHNDINRHR